MIPVIIWVFLILVSAAGYIMFDGPVLLVLACFLTLSGAVLLFLLQGQKKRVAFSFGGGPAAVRRKKNAQIKLVMTVNSKIPSACARVCIELSSPCCAKKKDRREALFSADGRRETVLFCRIPSEHCGIWRAEAIKIRLYDFLGIFSVSLPVPQGKEICILPEVYEIRVLPESLPDVFREEEGSEDAKGSDPSVLHQIREYRPGDSIRQIHWKLSARSEQWMVREYGTAAERGKVLLWMDAGGQREGASERENRKICPDGWFAAAVSVTAALLSAAVITELVWYDKGRERRFLVDSEQSFNDMAGEMVRAEISGEKHTEPDRTDGEMLLRLDTDRRLWKEGECLICFPDAEDGKEKWEQISFRL